MIEVQELTKVYGKRTVVDNLSFEVGQGEIVGFLGPNGAGKSTTMRILTGFIAATSGTARIAGHDVYSDSMEARREIGYMPENVPLYTDMRVKEYLHFRARLKGMDGRAMRKRVGEVMEICGLIDVRKKMIGTLSKGFRQRVGLADALVHRPRLLILDEPTNGLDPNQIRQVRDLIRTLAEHHTILLSTHILSEVEMVCSRVIILNGGKVQATGTPLELIAEKNATGLVTVEIQGNKDELLRGLRRIRSVRKADILRREADWHTFELRIEGNGDVRETIFDLCVKNNWKMRVLTQETLSLEDVFVDLTG